MNYRLVKNLIELAENFESENSEKVYTEDIDGFKNWFSEKAKSTVEKTEEPNWVGKEHGRSPESVISTLIVHMNRYAKTYSKSAIYDSDFSTQEEFIYLINLKAYGAMGKMELIKKNIQEKPVGMQIINRLIAQGWVQQNDSPTDKRSKIIYITEKGMKSLDAQMKKIRQASEIVTGNLSYEEKMDLIRLLNKLNDFHQPIFFKNIEPAKLLESVSTQNSHSKN